LIRNFSKITVSLLALFLLAGCTPEEPVKSSAVPERSTAVSENPTINTHLPVRDDFKKIPVLMFHYVRTVNQKQDVLGYNLSEDPQTFDKLLSSLEKKGYQTIHAADLLNGTKLPDKPIILTFDDGYEDFYTTAWPELQKHGFTASEAIITGKMQEDKLGVTYMNEQQVKDLDQHDIEILSHTVSHIDLDKATAERQQKELSDSKQILEKLLGHPVNGLVYPAGRYNQDTLKIAADLGYQIAFTTKPGLDSSTQNWLEFPRLRVDNRDSIDQILREL
jgi:peptidoglycan/xylan/chitin deacetylase (PgdA/CDA1 family)